MTGLGIILIGLRGYIPDLLSFQLAQLMVAVGIFTRVWAIRIELNQELKDYWKPYLVLYGIYLLTFNYTVIAEWPTRDRLLLTHIFQILTVLDFTILNFRLMRIHKNRNSFAVFFYVSLLLLLSIVVSIYSVFNLKTLDSIFAPAPYQYFHTFSQLILIIFGNYAFLKLKLEKISELYAQDQAQMAAKLALKNQAIEHSNKLMALSQERELLMNQLNKSAKASTLGMFASAIAHELNQPLAAIRLNAQGLLRTMQSNNTSKLDPELLIQNIIHDNDRAANIIKTLRTLLLDGEDQKEIINLNEITKEILSSVQSQIDLKQIHLSLRFHDQKLEVFANKTQLQQAILNLINNAIDVISDLQVREILIETKVLSSGLIEVSIADSGPGIPEEQLSRLFEPFASSKKFGMGVGLAISQSIISNHFGTIEVENTPNSGAKFSIQLPKPKKAKELYSSKQKIDSSKKQTSLF